MTAKEHEQANTKSAGHDSRGQVCTTRSLPPETAAVRPHHGKSCGKIFDFAQSAKVGLEDRTQWKSPACPSCLRAFVPACLPLPLFNHKRSAPRDPVATL